MEGRARHYESRGRYQNKMDVGLFLGTQHPDGADVRRAIEDHVAQTRAARDAGFSALWLAQHYLTSVSYTHLTLPTKRIV